VNLYSTSWDQVSTWTAPDWTAATLDWYLHVYIENKSLNYSKHTDSKEDS